MGRDDSPELDSDADADVSGTEVTDAEVADADESTAAPDLPEPVSAQFRIGPATIAGLAAVTVFGGLCGLLGYRLIQSREAENLRQELVEAAKQAAVNLTTIDYERADADVQRILDSSSGGFYDDFKARSASFADAVKKVKSKSVGTVNEAGLIPDSVTGSQGQVLVAVTMKVTNDGAADEQPQRWRMKLTVIKQGDQAKVSNVDFVS